jgi:hypothetical protein
MIVQLQIGKHNPAKTARIKSGQLDNINENKTQSCVRKIFDPLLLSCNKWDADQRRPRHIHAAHGQKGINLPDSVCASDTFQLLNSE